MTTEKKVRITWNGVSSEIDAVVVKDDSDRALTVALINLVKGNLVSPGDSFTVEEIQS